MKYHTYIILLSLCGLSSSQSDCSLDFVCDPSPESDIHTAQFHYQTAAQCQSSCKYVHDNSVGPPTPECNFFTFRANMPSQSMNCHFLKECRKLASPSPGMSSGVANCDDTTFFCDSLMDETPAYDDKKAYWTCDSGHPYGGSKINQGAHCTVGCPSFKNGDTAVEQVSSNCEWNEENQKSEWTPATPAGVTMSDGETIVSPSENPLPTCGCGNLVLTGEIAPEQGKVFVCTNGDGDSKDPTVTDGNTIIADDMECLLLCDGVFVFDLFCSSGVWSIGDLDEAADIFCYNGGDGGNSVTLSTWFPPPNTTPNDNPTDPPTDPPTNPTDPTDPTDPPTASPQL